MFFCIIEEESTQDNSYTGNVFMENSHNEPKYIEVRGACVHNLKNVNVNVPLHQIVGIAGVSGSGKSSLALGVLYAEGSRRYLESLSTYTRRRMTRAAKAQVDEVLYVPAALALHQRPGIPGIRSTFGTGTELLNSLRLMYSRLASHRCPNGHYVPPTLKVAAEQEIICPECGERVHAPSAEQLAFNSQGACPKCGGTGSVRTVDLDSLVPDDSISIDEAAVAPGGWIWRGFGQYRVVALLGLLASGGVVAAVVGGIARLCALHGFKLFAFTFFTPRALLFIQSHLRFAARYG